MCICCFGSYIVGGNLKGNTGYVRYVGPVHGKAEDVIYIGVELDDPVGKHNGTVKGKRYFKCRDRYGYLAPVATFSLFGKSKLKRKTRKYIYSYFYHYYYNASHNNI